MLDIIQTILTYVFIIGCVANLVLFIVWVLVNKYVYNS